MKDLTDRELLVAVDSAVKIVVERFKVRREAAAAAREIPPPASRELPPGARPILPRAVTGWIDPSSSARRK
jgi:hypothetical protein